VKDRFLGIKDPISLFSDLLGSVNVHTLTKYSLKNRPKEKCGIIAAFPTEARVGEIIKNNPG